MPRANEVWGKVIFSETPVILFTGENKSAYRVVCIQGVCLQGVLPIGGVLPGRSAYRGVCIQGVCLEGGLPTGGLATLGSAHKRGLPLEGWGDGRPPESEKWIRHILLECFLVGDCNWSEIVNLLWCRKCIPA